MDKLLEFKNNIKGKKVGLIGIGVSNLPVVEYLYSLGAKVVLFDKNTNLLNEHETLSGLDLECHLGDDYLKHLQGLDYIFRSPGIRPFYPELEEAKEKRYSYNIRDRNVNSFMSM